MLETCSILFCSETSISISVSEKEQKENHVLLTNIEFELNVNPNNWILHWGII